MAARLPQGLTLPEARRSKARLASSLTPGELELFTILGNGRERVFGDLRSEDVLLTTPSRAAWRSVREREEEASQILVALGAAAQSLVRAGWARHHRGPLVDSGYFYLTEAGEKVFRALGEKR